MSAHLTEEQQIEALKAWWKEYGKSIIFGVVIAIAVGFGWQWYQRYETQKRDHASLVYMYMMHDMETGNMESAKRQANVLRTRFARTPYAVLSSFVLAQDAVQKNNLDDAVEYLQWAVHHTHVTAFEDMAKIRLARVYLTRHEPKEALAVLKVSKNDVFASRMAEVRGDVYVEMKELEKARDAYAQALQKMPSDAATRPLLQMKLNDLSASEGAHS